METRTIDYNPSQLTNLQKEISVFTDKQIQQFLQDAKNKIDEIKGQLEKVYKNELKPDHKTFFWDPHPVRHKEKINIARQLQSLCSTPIKQLGDLNHFISQYEELMKQNSRIDKNGGKLGSIFKATDQYVKNLGNDLYDLTQKVRNTSENMQALLYHFKAMRHEYINSRQEPKDYLRSFSYQLHCQEIKKIRKHFLAKYENMPVKDIYKLYRNLKKAKVFFPMYDTVLDITTSPSLKHNLEMDLANEDTQKELNNLPDKEKASYLLIKMLLAEFSSHLKMEEKIQLYQHYIDEKNNIDARLHPEWYQKRLNWYKECYWDENMEDSLQTNELAKNLNQLTFVYIDDIREGKIETVLKRLLNEHLLTLNNLSNPYFKNGYKEKFLKNWKNHLESQFKQLTDKIKTAEKLLQGDNSILKTIDKKTLSSLHEIVEVVKNTLPTAQEASIGNKTPKPDRLAFTNAPKTNGVKTNGVFNNRNNHPARISNGPYVVGGESNTFTPTRRP